MLPNERALAKKNGVLFEQYRQEALQRASEIVTSRERVRDVEMPIWTKVAFGLRGYVVFIYQKASRLVANVEARDRSYTRKGMMSSEEFKALEATVDEELLDIINYCSFAWAYRQMQEQREPSTVCTKGAFGDALVSCLCPKCKAERVERIARHKTAEEEGTCRST